MKIKALAIVAALAINVPAANASVIIYVSQQGGDVFAQTTGSLNIAGMTPVTQNTSSHGVRGAQFFFTGTPGLTVNAYSGLTGATPFGSMLNSGTGITSGAPFGFHMSNGRVFLPTNYVSGSEIVSSATYQFKTIADLELNLGTYNFGFGPDTITLNIGQAAPVASVPEPATWAMFIGGFALIGGAMRRRRKTTVRYA